MVLLLLNYHACQSNYSDESTAIRSSWIHICISIFYIFESLGARHLLKLGPCEVGSLLFEFFV